MERSNPTATPREKGAEKPFGTCVMLAGGEGERMGFDKQLLQGENGSLALETVAMLGEAFSRVIVMTERPELYPKAGAIIARDILPKCGPLAGIFSALTLCRDPYLYVAACDMPHIDLNLIKKLFEVAAKDKPDAVIFGRFNHLEPLNAVYSTDIIPRLREFLLSGGRKVHTFLEKINIRVIEADNLNAEKDPFLNLNYQNNTGSAVRDGGLRLTENFSVCRFSGENRFEVEETIAREEIMRLYINGRAAGDFAISPDAIEELAAGFLLTEGYIGSAADLVSLEIGEEDGDFAVRAHCLPPSSDRVKPPAADIRFSVRDILLLSPLFLGRSQNYEKTGGVQSAAIAAQNQLVCFFEDVGRHNAADKAIGYCLINGVDLSDKLMLTSGRVPAKIAEKAFAAGLPLLVSRSAPTTAAVKTARRNGLTLVAFARNGRFNVYAHEERLSV